MTKRHLIAVLCIIGAGALAGAGAWYRLSRVTPESDPIAYWMQEGARAYSRMDSVSVRNAEGIRHAMAGATVEDAEGVLQLDPSLLDPLRETVFDFLTTRFTAPSAPDYVSSMESRGYRFKTGADFEKRYGPLKDQADYVGLDTGDVPTLFGAMWAHPLSRKAVPDALCTGPEAMTITFGHSNRNHFTTQVPAGVLGTNLWHGGAGATCRFWMGPPVTREDLIALHGEIVAAQVGVIACIPGSSRRPLIVNLFFDPDSSRWWIDGVSITNYIPPPGSGMCAEY